MKMVTRKYHFRQLIRPMRTEFPIGRSQLIERHGSVYGLKLCDLDRLPQGYSNFIRIVLGTYSRNPRPQTTHRYIDPSHLSISFFILPKAKGMPKTYTIDNPTNRNI